MTTAIIDTYKLISTLKSRGFTEEQANGIREAIEQIDMSNLATKTDISDLKVEIFKWSVPMLLGQAGVIVALMKAFG